MDDISKAIIELPTANDPIEDNTRVFISGWGQTEDANASKELRAVVVLTINQEKCDKAYYWDGGISDEMICAGSSGKDSCNVRFVDFFINFTLNFCFFCYFRVIQVR